MRIPIRPMGSALLINDTAYCFQASPQLPDPIRKSLKPSAEGPWPWFQGCSPWLPAFQFPSGVSWLHEGFWTNPYVPRQHAWYFLRFHSPVSIWHYADRCLMPSSLASMDSNLLSTPSSFWRIRLNISFNSLSIICPFFLPCFPCCFSVFVSYHIRKAKSMYFSGFSLPNHPDSLQNKILTSFHAGCYNKALKPETGVDFSGTGSIFRHTTAFCSCVFFCVINPDRLPRILIEMNAPLAVERKRGIDGTDLHERTAGVEAHASYVAAHGDFHDG